MTSFIRQVSFRWHSSPTPHARLHGSSNQKRTWASLPTPLRTTAVEAELTDEHLSALFVWMGLGSVATVGAAAVVGSIAGLLMAALIIIVPVGIVWRRAGRRTQRLVAALPDLVDMTGRSLRSGASLMQALDEARADSPPALEREFELVLAAMRRGQPAGSALRAWVDRVPHAEVRIVAAALAIASRNESGTSRALDGVSQSLRDRASLRQEVRSQTAQAAASMQALVVLPAVFLGLDAVGSGETVRFLWVEPFGRLCLLVAVLLDLVGGIWISSMVRRRSPV